MQRWMLLTVERAIKRYGLENEAAEAMALYALYLDTQPGEPSYHAKMSPDAFMSHYGFLRCYLATNVLHNPKGPH